MKKIIVLLVVLLLIASTIQVAFAEPPGPIPASCHMVASWWPPDPETGDTGPGNSDNFEDGQRGMWHVHMHENHPRGYTNGAQHMDIICPG
jgi:hypothetical protein